MELFVASGLSYETTRNPLAPTQRNSTGRWQTMYMQNASSAPAEQQEAVASRPHSFLAGESANHITGLHYVHAGLLGPLDSKSKIQR